MRVPYVPYEPTVHCVGTGGTVYTAKLLTELPPGVTHYLAGNPLTQGVIQMLGGNSSSPMFEMSHHSVIRNYNKNKIYSTITQD